MKEGKTLELHKYTKILVPANANQIAEDKRLLIPYTSGEKIGFINKDRKIVVPAEYSMYYGECYDKGDYIRVCKPKDNSSNTLVYGLINAKGELVLPPQYYKLRPASDSKEIFTAENMKYQHGVITADGEVVVPFGKYNYIDGFTKGFARVKIGKAPSNLKNSGNKWGLIDTNGNEVLPVEYDSIWNFYDKPHYNSITVDKNGVRKSIKFSELKQMQTNEEEYSSYNYGYDYDDDYGSHYGEYAGTYAQDEMGYSDDIINDAFEGDSEAYWNID